MRSANAEAAIANKDGLVEAPGEMPSSGDEMDRLFSEEMGREPNSIDHTPDRDRERAEAAAEEEQRASQYPDADPIENDPDPEADAAKAAAEKKASEDLQPAEDPQPKDFLDELVPNTAKKTVKAVDQDEEDPYKDVKLRSDASEKTKTTFEDLKRVAKEREKAARAERDEYKAKFDALESEASSLREKSSKLPENVEGELKELREFRATFDAQNDPEFKKTFDSRLESNNNAVFEILKRNGLKEELIEQVKNLPHEDQVDQISRWAEKLTAREKFQINGKLADSENVVGERQAKLAEIRTKADSILAEKKNAPTTTKETYLKEAAASLREVLPHVDFIATKIIPSTATPQEKVALERHNAEAIEEQKKIISYLQDESPRTRGLMALAGVMAPRFRVQLQDITAKYEAVVKELDGIKNAGKLSRTARSSATPTAPQMDINQSSDDALEAAWKAMQG